MDCYREDLEKSVRKFKSKHDPYDRYASYDYCFNYFQPKTGFNLTDDIEKSCLVLGFYLASWGMFRGSSFILGKSLKLFEPLIEYVSELDASYWTIDVKDFANDYEKIIEIYKKISEILIPKQHQDLTLVTKIMLGIFGNTPAYDQYFVKSFRNIFKGECAFTTFNKIALKCIYEFYVKNKESIDKLSDEFETIDFISLNFKFKYTQSKIIDMYGFTTGQL